MNASIFDCSRRAFNLHSSLLFNTHAQMLLGEANENDYCDLDLFHFDFYRDEGEKTKRLGRREIYLNLYLIKAEFRQRTLTPVPVEIPNNPKGLQNMKSSPSKDVTPSNMPKMINKAPTTRCVMARTLTLDATILKKRVTKRWKSNARFHILQFKTGICCNM